MKNNQLLSDLKGKLIISCQASDKEPLYSPEAILKMAKASLEGGAFALRAEGVTSVRQMKHFFDCPVIGL
ncbi:MAG: N-acetylmannosamine-6-phosphate 2-epimerase, partial [Candidatus Sericytochromatia bacterium]